MEHLERPMTRGGLLRAGAVGAAGLVAAGTAGRALGATRVDASGVTLNWLTWSDHYFTNQLQAVKKSTGIGGRVQLISDDSDAYIKVKQGGGALGHLVGGRAVGAQVLQGRADRPLRHQGRSRSRSSCTRSRRRCRSGRPATCRWAIRSAGRACRSTTTRSTSRRSRTATTRFSNKAYKKRIVLENQPTDLMAMAGLATGAKQPYNMTTAEISKREGLPEAAQAERAEAGVAEHRGRARADRSSPRGSRSRTSAPTSASSTRRAP